MYAQYQLAKTALVVRWLAFEQLAKLGCLSWLAGVASWLGVLASWPFWLLLASVLGLAGLWNGGPGLVLAGSRVWLAGPPGLVCPGWLPGQLTYRAALTGLRGRPS